MFVPGKPFQPSLMFVGKAGAYPNCKKFCKFLHLFGFRIIYSTPSHPYLSSRLAVDSINLFLLSLMSATVLVTMNKVLLNCQLAERIDGDGRG